MTTAPVGQPFTVGAFLFPNPRAHPALSLATRLTDSGVAQSISARLPGLSATLVASVNQETANVVAELLTLSVPALAVNGWRRHRELQAAARRTLAAVNSEELVELATHRITSTHRPEIDLFVDAVRIGSVQLEISVIFDIKAAVAVVRRGYLVSLRTGRTDITARLAVDGALIAERTQPLDLNLVVPLRTPVQLLHNDEPLARTNRLPGDNDRAR